MLVTVAMCIVSLLYEGSGTTVQSLNIIGCGTLNHTYVGDESYFMVSPL